ncbi:MAG TPA: hypothetical protein VFY44_04880 [Thermoleophilaceae bacterium]|nr:hypothetical protein [Thermoleophilaceae bacterium]
MTQQSNWQAQAGIGPGQRGQAATGWAAWISFAAVILAVIGVLQIMQGLAALIDDGFYVVRESGLVVNVDYSVWGWTHMLLGIVAILVAAGLLAGNTVARVAGVILAMVSAIVNLAFLPAYPWWSTVVIVFDVLVIYALTAHGGEMKQRH